ncbi:cation diffusion facilitator family transporter [Rubrobacter aplysinae]|uniref:cation diffusion facilitator family transporter n=1 Tax=Rubrobacter aplysinae TaxID=909625 RepID=UPI00064C05D7|nr:cation diffusion facilitator family transporter [Rubrobacter aplysinae]
MAGSGNGEQGTRRAITAAFIANFCIAVAKFVAGFISGSSALLAEGAHSVADTVNQVFLYVSLSLGRKPPDEEHPYGHGKDRFFWSLLVSVGLFIAGAVFSVYEGFTAIIGGEGGEHGSFLIGYIVLGIAFVFELGALAVAVREFRHAAAGEGRTFWRYFRVTRNTTLKVPLYEDAAALTGLVIAAAGLFLTQTTGNQIYDGLASIGVGIVLIFVAWELGTDSRALLLGESMLPEDRERLHEIVRSFPEVREVLRLITMHLGPNSVLVNAEVHLADELETDQIEDLLERITRKIRTEMPEAQQTFIELHSPARRV